MRLQGPEFGDLSLQLSYPRFDGGTPIFFRQRGRSRLNGVRGGGREKVGKGFAPPPFPHRDPSDERAMRVFDEPGERFLHFFQ